MCYSCYTSYAHLALFFFFQAEDGIRVIGVTGVQTCALPISFLGLLLWTVRPGEAEKGTSHRRRCPAGGGSIAFGRTRDGKLGRAGGWGYLLGDEEIGRASCRERGQMRVVAVSYQKKVSNQDG